MIHRVQERFGHARQRRLARDAKGPHEDDSRPPSPITDRVSANRVGEASPLLAFQFRARSHKRPTLLGRAERLLFFSGAAESNPPLAPVGQTGPSPGGKAARRTVKA
ncbi:hypothetical protein D3877_25330 [Azospirillum cavernae]|uniref:Uncharacterized protein n=1 Tax=Azospirillum cavernae TaxID=2320860 RepID=A0A418VQ77_9PROT|nr:hypothetical protein D3877_25330 [Azospirillum cavernae]